MTALHRLYTLGVLWLLSVIAQDAAEVIYKHGREDGMTELRAFMRRELSAVRADAAAERLRSYNNGFRDAMRYLDAEEPLDDAPIERVM
jgi:hypothetical protein